jgi:hypothetical protein
MEENTIHEIGGMEIQILYGKNRLGWKGIWVSKEVCFNKKYSKGKMSINTYRNPTKQQ